MNCRDIDDRLTAHLDDRLASAEASAWRAHVASCARCRDKVAAGQRVERLLSAQGAAEPAADLVARIMDGVPTQRRPEPSTVTQWNRIALPFACVAAAAALVLGLRDRSAPEVPPVDPIETVTTRAGLEELFAMPRP